MVARAIMGLIALVTGTGKANCTRLRLVQFQALPVPVTRAIKSHIALSTTLLIILIEHILYYLWLFVVENLSCV